MSGRFFPLVFAACALALLSCTSTAIAPMKNLPESAVSRNGLGLKREFRGAWIASFMNIDYPTRPSVSGASLQTDIDTILDRVQELNLNAVILQVRSCCDSLYPSALEPWSSYLSGSQGRAPEGGFDPLASWISGARARGIRIYAWMNPFRAGAPSISDYADSSPVKAHPEWTRRLGGGGYAWLDPGIPAARDYVVGVARELARAYDVDGIFIDDYFYPYPEQLGGLSDFPDEESYAAYASAGGQLTKPDWRRENTLSFVRAMSAALRSVRPGLAFGVSPSGIWKADPMADIKGRSSYYESFADSKSWLNEGLCDIFSPQLYWPISRVHQSFPVLLRFWLGENLGGRALWPSLKLVDDSLDQSSRARESLSQIMVNRAMSDAYPGSILYGWRELAAQDSPLGTMLREGAFADKALIPALPWLPSDAAVILHASVAPEADRLLVEWECASAREIVLRYGESPSNRNQIILPASAAGFSLPIKPGAALVLSLTALGHNGCEGDFVELEYSP
jgi:uncharacterized lipoprotein YddW (UPF0748 family)